MLGFFIISFNFGFRVGLIFGMAVSERRKGKMELGTGENGKKIIINKIRESFCMGY